MRGLAHLASTFAAPAVATDICGELHGIPQHQCFHLVAYDLHSKWPKVLPAGSIATSVISKFLSSLPAGVCLAPLPLIMGPSSSRPTLLPLWRGRGLNTSKQTYTTLGPMVVWRGSTKPSRTGSECTSQTAFLSYWCCSTLHHYRTTPHATTD